MGIETLLITQARYGSTRLPGKVLKKIKSKTLLQIQLERLLTIKDIDRVVVATSTNELDQQIVDECNRLGVESYRGSETDVLDRFYRCALNYKPKYIIRVTSDCPLLDPKLVQTIIGEMKKGGYDYYSNIYEEKFPDGQDVEIMKLSVLKDAWEKAELPSEKEHVTPFIRKNNSLVGGNLYSAGFLTNEKDYHHVRMTVDEEKDFQVISKLIHDLGDDKSWETYTQHYLNTPEIKELNQMIIRNEGYLKSMKKDKNHE